MWPYRSLSQRAHSSPEMIGILEIDVLCAAKVLVLYQTRRAAASLFWPDAQYPTYGRLAVQPQSAQSTQRGARIAGVLSRPAFRGGYRGTPLPSTGSGCTLHGKKSRPPRGTGVPPVSNHGQDAHATAGDDGVLLILLSAPLRLCVTFLPPFFPSPALAGLQPGFSTKGFIRPLPRKCSRTHSQRDGFGLTMREMFGSVWG